MKALIITAVVFLIAGIGLIASTANSDSSSGAGAWIAFLVGCVAALIGIGTGIAALVVRATRNKDA